MKLEILKDHTGYQGESYNAGDTLTNVGQKEGRKLIVLGRAKEVKEGGARKTADKKSASNGNPAEPDNDGN